LASPKSAEIRGFRRERSRQAPRKTPLKPLRTSQNRCRFSAACRSAWCSSVPPLPWSLDARSPLRLHRRSRRTRPRVWRSRPDTLAVLPDHQAGNAPGVDLGDHSGNRRSEFWARMRPVLDAGLTWRWGNCTRLRLILREAKAPSLLPRHGAGKSIPAPFFWCAGRLFFDGRLVGIVEPAPPVARIGGIMASPRSEALSIAIHSYTEMIAGTGAQTRSLMPRYPKLNAAVCVRIKLIAVRTRSHSTCLSRSP
jgi:hypothetical protein